MVGKVLIIMCPEYRETISENNIAPNKHCLLVTITSRSHRWSSGKRTPTSYPSSTSVILSKGRRKNVHPVTREAFSFTPQTRYSHFYPIPESTDSCLPGSPVPIQNHKQQPLILDMLKDMLKKIYLVFGGKGERMWLQLYKSNDTL